MPINETGQITFEQPLNVHRINIKSKRINDEIPIEDIVLVHEHYNGM